MLTSTAQLFGLAVSRAHRLVEAAPSRFKSLSDLVVDILSALRFTPQPPVALHLWVDFYPVSSIELNVSSLVSDGVTRATLDACVSAGEWYYVSRLLSTGQGILGRLAEPIDRTFATHPEPQLHSAFTRALPDIKYTVTCAAHTEI